jgi:protein ImuB
VACFAAAARERAEPALRERPLAITTGAPPVTRVVEASAVARASGVVPGITEAEARERCSGLVSRPAAPEDETSSRQALLEAALSVSPRIEDAGPGLVHVDLQGLESLHGDEAAIAARLLVRAARVGLEGQVGIASTRTVARIAAGLGPRVTIIPPGREREALAPVPLGSLDLPPEPVQELARWGVHTVGDLAALPRAGLADRLGAMGLDALFAEDPPFRPYTPPPFWEEAQGVDWEIDTLDGVAVVLERVLARLCARLAAAHVLADALVVRLQLASGARHERTVSLAVPLGEARPMLTLLRLELEASPPPAPVTHVAVSAHAVRVRPGQGGLWQPAAPALRDLAVVLVKLAALVGPASVGSPRVLDTHRPDAFALVPFVPETTPRDGVTRTGREPGPVSGASGSREAAADPDASPLALRRLRPPRPVEVDLAGERPGSVTWNGTRFRVTAQAGPWRASGEWWDVRLWACDEWDVALHDRTLCRLSHDRLTGRWTLAGVYD